MLEKEIYWIGSSLNDLKSFPHAVRQYFGYELHKLQKGGIANDIKALSGKNLHGVWELRERYDTNAYRVIYTVKIKDKIFVLHCFQKKTQKTSQKDINIIETRLKQISEEEGDN